jgi:ATPase subunit of ABC transporter with duplicated ATPase domains
MTDTGPLLTLTNLTAGYQQPVVGPVSLSVLPGELIALEGPNGCGKSTLLKAILGHSRCFSGSIHRSPGLRIAALEQHSPWPRELPITGRELLQLMNSPADTLPVAMQAVLPKRLDALSGGQRQLLRIWMALHQRVDLLLLDEPTNNLDADSEALITDMIRDRRGTIAMLLISHEQAFLEGLTPRTVEVG